MFHKTTRAIAAAAVFTCWLASSSVLAGNPQIAYQQQYPVAQQQGRGWLSAPADMLKRQGQWMEQMGDGLHRQGELLRARAGELERQDSRMQEQFELMRRHADWFVTQVGAVAGNVKGVLVWVESSTRRLVDNLREPAQWLSDRVKAVARQLQNFGDNKPGEAQPRK